MNFTIEAQTDKYNTLVAQHFKELPGRMFTFEVTKCCGYSTFVFLYREDNLLDLYSQIAKHFACCNLVSLYLLDQNGSKINIPFNSHTTLKDFILEHTQSNNRCLKPIYDIPLPVVYRIYIDDGHHNHEHIH
jgi:hypothetical protein